MNTRGKWLIGLVVILVILNITLLATIWLKTAHSDNVAPRGDARNYLVTSLLLDEAQIKAFDSLRTGHFNRIRMFKDEMRQLKDQLFDQLSQPGSIRIDTLAQQIGVCQSKIDIETFNHFLTLRMLLHPQQIGLFDRVIRDVLHAPPPDNAPPPPGRGPGNRPEGSN